MIGSVIPKRTKLMEQRQIWTNTEINDRAMSNDDQKSIR